MDVLISIRAPTTWNMAIMSIEHSFGLRPLIPCTGLLMTMPTTTAMSCIQVEGLDLHNSILEGLVNALALDKLGVEVVAEMSGKGILNLVSAVNNHYAVHSVV